MVTQPTTFVPPYSSNNYITLKCICLFTYYEKESKIWYKLQMPLPTSRTYIRETDFSATHSQTLVQMSPTDCDASLCMI